MNGGDIRDIRPLILIPPWWYWLAAAIAGALILALVGVAIRYWRRRSRRPITPLERARLALAQAEDMARAGRCREWAELCAETLRSTLAARLGVPACPETTNELAQTDWASRAPGVPVDAASLVELLSTCDLTRFALGRLEPNALVDANASALRWVEGLFAPTPEPASKSKPSPAAVPPTPAPNAA